MPTPPTTTAGSRAARPLARLIALGAAVMTIAAGAGRAQEPVSDATPEPARVVGHDLSHHALESAGRTYRYAIATPRFEPAGEPGDGPADGPDAATHRGLLFLHGYGECGDDGKKMLTVGLPPAIRANPERWPFVVVIPQKPVADSEWEHHEAAVLAMLDAAVAEHRVDPARLAVTGLSQGGHGTIWFATNHPDRFRAAAPVCGYIEPFWTEGRRTGPGDITAERARAIADALDGTPLWLLHGGKDTVVPPSESERLHAILEAAGQSPKLTIFPDDDHNSWDSAYRESGLWEWLVRMTD